MPKEVYLDKTLSWTEKILLIEINSLDDDENLRANGEPMGCYASNKYLSEFVQKTEKTIANLVCDLKQKGWIFQLWNDGRGRGLRTCFHGSHGKAEFPKTGKHVPENGMSFPENGIGTEVAFKGNTKEINIEINKEYTETRTRPDFGFPLDNLFAAFPDLQITPAQCGSIVAEVKPEDHAAWLATIKTYTDNYNPAKKTYLPEKVGNLLNVFRSEKARLAKASQQDTRTAAALAVGKSSSSESNDYKPNDPNDSDDFDDFDEDLSDFVKPLASNPPIVDRSAAGYADWLKLINELKTELNPQIYQVWFANLSFFGISSADKTVNVGGSDVARDWIEKFYNSVIAESLTKIGLDGYSFKWRLNNKK